MSRPREEIPDPEEPLAELMREGKLRSCDEDEEPLPTLGRSVPRSTARRSIEFVPVEPLRDRDREVLFPENDRMLRSEPAIPAADREEDRRASDDRRRPVE